MMNFQGAMIECPLFSGSNPDAASNKINWLGDLA